MGLHPQHDSKIGGTFLSRRIFHYQIYGLRIAYINIYQNELRLFIETLTEVGDFPGLMQTNKPGLAVTLWIR